MRKDCTLAKLTEEQQADLFDWLTTDSYDVVLKRIAQPPPDGFGIRTHINTLFRFYDQRLAQIRAHDLAGLTAQTKESNSDAAQSPVSAAQSFFNAASSAFAHSTYRLAHSPMTPVAYRAVSRALHQQEDAGIKREFLEIAREQVALGRERLQLERAQFEYNAARAALSLLPELIAIDQLTNIDDEAKIWRVRDRLFGVSPIGPIPKTPGEKGAMIDAECNVQGVPAAASPHPAISPEERVSGGNPSPEQRAFGRSPSRANSVECSASAPSADPTNFK